MRKLFTNSKLFLSILVFAFIFLSCLTSYGFSMWIFDTKTSSDIETNLVADPIRENATFNDGFDMVQRGNKYYDVYFMAQSVPDSTLFNGNSIRQPYFNQDISFGYFANYEGVTNTSTSKNQYFIKYESVAEISTSQYDEATNNISNYLVDDISNSNEIFQLEFLCWSLTPSPIYGIDGNQWPTSFTTIHYNGTNYKQVQGWYPYSSDFTIFYMNTLLSYYENVNEINYFKDINGRKSLFLYPVFTIGKNYYDYRDDKRGNEIKDSIEIHNGEKSQFATYDGLTTSELDMDNVEVYRFDNYLIESNDEITITNDMNRKSQSSAWNGNEPFKHTIRSNLDLNQNLNINVSTGRFNIYLVVKEYNDTSSWLNPWDQSDYDKHSFTSDEISRIDARFEELNIGKYYSLESSTYGAHEEYYFGLTTYHNDVRDYYIYFERIYEPRIIGGASNEISYSSQYSLENQFVRQGTDDELKDRYEITNITLDGSSMIEYVLSNGNKLVFPNYYFAIMLNPEIDFNTYSFNFLDDTTPEYNNYEESKVPTITFVNNNQEITTPFKSSSIFRQYNYDLDDDVYFEDASGNRSSLQEAVESSKYDYQTHPFILIKPISEDSNLDGGVFTITIDIKYQTNENGIKVPNLIDIYGFKLSNIFINICENVSYGLEIDGNSNNNYVNTSFYSYRKDDYSQLDFLSLDDEYNDSGDRVTKTLGEILKDLESQGKCLKEIVTSRYITYSNLDPSSNEYVPFRIMKNYVFEIVNLPN